MRHLIDTNPRLAECNRCHEYVLAGVSAGIRYAVDIGPLGVATRRAVILAGGSVYYIFDRYMHLLTAHSITRLDDRYRTYSAHSCGCKALDASVFEEKPVPPLPAPVTGVQAVSGAHRDSTVDWMGIRCTVVEHASPRRSDVVRCSECREIIHANEDRFMIEIPKWQVNTHKVPNRGSRKGYTRTYEGWGYERWAIHTDGCR